MRQAQLKHGWRDQNQNLNIKQGQEYSVWNLTLPQTFLHYVKVLGWSDRVIFSYAVFLITRVVGHYFAPSSLHASISCSVPKTRTCVNPISNLSHNTESAHVLHTAPIFQDGNMICEYNALLSLRIGELASQRCDASTYDTTQPQNDETCSNLIKNNKKWT